MKRILPSMLILLCCVAPVNGQEADSLSAEELVERIERFENVATLIAGATPYSKHDMISAIDSILNVIRSRLEKDSPLYEKWLWYQIRTYQETDRYTMTKPLLDTLDSLYREKGETKELYNLHESYAYYGIFTYNLEEAEKHAKLSLKYAKNAREKIIGLKSLRDLSEYTDWTGTQTCRLCKKMASRLHRHMEFSGDYVPNLEKWFYAGGDSIAIVRKAKKFRQSTENMDERFDAGLVLSKITGDTAYLHDIINEYLQYRQKKSAQDKDLLISERDRLSFKLYLKALTELMYTDFASKPDQCLKYTQIITDFFEHPDTSSFYAFHNEAIMTTDNYAWHESYIPALMAEMLIYMMRYAETGNKEDCDEICSAIDRMTSVYINDIEHVSKFINDMPEYDIRIWLDKYYAGVQNYGFTVATLQNWPMMNEHIKDMFSISMFYKGLLLRKSVFGTADVSRDGEMFTFEHIQSLLDKCPDNSFFVDFTLLEDSGEYVMCVAGQNNTILKAIKTGAIDRDMLDNPGAYQNSELYDAIWGKLTEICPYGADIFFVPDGDLYSANIEMLADKNGTCAAQRYNLHRLSSFLEVDSINTGKCSMESAALFGGIDQSLKKSEGEITVISDMLTTDGCKTETFEKTECTEGAFRRLSGNSPDILHFSSHAFYLDYNEYQKSAFFNESYSGPEYYDRSKLNSGIVMNRGPENSGKEDDGMLLAKEISELDLQGTDLAVLSCCESGLGDTTFDGVLGLQRAFKEAGVQSLILTLWNVSDNAAALFSTAFYYSLTRCRNIRTSFLDAVYTVRETYPEPYYWAPFILID